MRRWREAGSRERILRAVDEATGLKGWTAAVRLLSRWLDQHERLDELLEALPSTLSGVERARCQHLVFGVIRHFRRIDAALARLVAHPPRFSTRAILFVAGFELIEASTGQTTEGLVAKIVHHAVEQTKGLASPAEARLVNAVVRKLAAVFAAQTPPVAGERDADAWGEYYSHPTWLVRHWIDQFGGEATRRLLEWNQQPAAVYARWRSETEAVPSFFRPTRWPGFHEIPSGHWREVEPLLKSGKLYLQNPGTRLAIDALNPQSGETILDLCAAPGGKSVFIADRMKQGRLVAVDLPGARIDRLKDNLSRTQGVDVALVQADLTADLAEQLRAHHNLPTRYDAVLIDVPCSNTGVMRHRADVKWRLQEGDFKKHAEQQLGLLHAAARFVAPGGRLVYSTCSIEADENEGVVRQFFESRAGSPFLLQKKEQSFPWEREHDGAGVFVLIAAS